MSKRAKQRLQVLDHARQHGVSAASRHFAFARSTIYRWRQRYDPTNLSSLEDRSSRPAHVRHRTWTAEQATAVRTAREAHPRWGKDKLAVVRRRDGIIRSVSMVGRILTHLTQTGQLVAAPTSRLQPHTRHVRPYAVRTPKDLVVEQPGDLVQVDTMPLTPLPGVERRHFSAVDVVSRSSVVGVRGTATAGTARDCLGDLIDRGPFAIKAMQVDGGSEFKAAFETACQERDLARYVLPPRSPTLNGRVERVNGTHRREFWECYADDLDLPTLQAARRAWEHEYHEVRPHQALGYHTPAEFLAARSPPDLSHRS